MPPRTPATDQAVRYSDWIRVVKSRSEYSDSYRVTFPPSLNMGRKKTNFSRTTLTLYVTIPDLEWHFQNKTAEERALILQHTLLKAALDPLKGDHDRRYNGGPFDCVVVVLWDESVRESMSNSDSESSDEPDGATVLAKAVYSPDCGGVSGTDQLANRNFEITWPPPINAPLTADQAAAD